MYLLSKIVSAGASALRSGALIAHATSLTLTITPTVISAVQLSKQMQLRESLIAQEVQKKSFVSHSVSEHVSEIVREPRESLQKKASQEAQLKSLSSSPVMKAWSVLPSRSESFSKAHVSERGHVEAEVREALKSYESKEAGKARSGRSLSVDGKSNRARPSAQNDNSRRSTSSASNLIQRSTQSLIQSLNPSSQTLARVFASLGTNLALSLSSASTPSAPTNANNLSGNSTTPSTAPTAPSTILSTSSVTPSPTNSVQNPVAPATSPPPTSVETHATHILPSTGTPVSPSPAPISPVVVPTPSPVTLPTVSPSTSPTVSTPAPSSSPSTTPDEITTPTVDTHSSREASSTTPSNQERPADPIISGAVYRIQSTCDASKVLGLFGSSALQEAPLTLLTNAPDDFSQEWKVSQDSQGNYQFQVLHTQFMMDVQYADSYSGRSLIQWPRNGGLNQSFMAISNSDGSFSLQAKHSGMYVTGSLQDSSVVQSSASGDCTQNFNFVPVTSSLGLCLQNSKLSSLDNYSTSSSILNYMYSSSGSTKSTQIQISTDGQISRVQPALSYFNVLDTLRLGTNQNFYLYQMDGGIKLYKLTDRNDIVTGFNIEAMNRLGIVQVLSQFRNVSLALDLRSNGKILVSAYSYQSSNVGFYPLAEVDPATGAASWSTLPGTGLPYCRVLRPLMILQSLGGEDSDHEDSGLDD